ncbi:MAG: hypothetical protein ACPHRO_10595, partial [Nannocystaceae bacterium]
VAAVAAPTTVSAKELTAAECKVHTVLATKNAAKDRIPSKLSFLKSELEGDQFAAYTSFKLLSSADFKLSGDKQISREAGGGHRVGLRLRGGSLSRPKIHIEVAAADKAKPLVSADYSVNSGSFLLLAGFRHPDGKLVFAIQCRGS